MRAGAIDDLLMRLDHLRRLGMIRLDLVRDLQPRLAGVDLLRERFELRDRAVELRVRVGPQARRIVGEEILLSQHAGVGGVPHRSIAPFGRKLPADENRLGEATIDRAGRCQPRGIDRAKLGQQRGWIRTGSRAASAAGDDLLDNRIEPRLRGRRLRGGRLRDCQG